MMVTYMTGMREGCGSWLEDCIYQYSRITTLVERWGEGAWVARGDELKAAVSSFAAWAAADAPEPPVRGTGESCAVWLGACAQAFSRADPQAGPVAWDLAFWAASSPEAPRPPEPFARGDRCAPRAADAAGWAGWLEGCAQSYGRWGVQVERFGESWAGQLSEIVSDGASALASWVQEGQGLPEPPATDRGAGAWEAWLGGCAQEWAAMREGTWEVWSADLVAWALSSPDAPPLPDPAVPPEGCAWVMVSLGCGSWFARAEPVDDVESPTGLSLDVDAWEPDGHGGFDPMGRGGLYWGYKTGEEALRDCLADLCPPGADPAATVAYPIPAEVFEVAVDRGARGLLARAERAPGFPDWVVPAIGLAFEAKGLPPAPAVARRPGRAAGL